MTFPDRIISSKDVDTELFQEYSRELKDEKVIGASTVM
jgi:hypothetical protein